MDGIGRMRRLLSLRKETCAPDGAGGAATAWVETARVFGAVEGLAGDDGSEAMRATGRIRYRVTLRYRAGVGAGQRLVEGARVLTIRAAFDPDGTRRRLVCLCEEET